MMKKIILFIVSVLAGVAPLSASEYHISPAGNDTNPGTAAQPFQTLECARDAVRSMVGSNGLPAGGVDVWLHGGEYVMTNVFTLTPQDSGQPGSTIRYHAAAGETPVLTSASAITGWQLYTNAADLALQPAASGHVWVAAIPIGWRFHYLYLDGLPQPVACMNKTNNWTVWPKSVAYGPAQPGGQPMTLSPGLLDNCPTNGDLEMNLMPVKWWNTLSPLTGINTASNSCLRQSKSPTMYLVNQFEVPAGNYNLQNALKFLTQPGEWCVDSAAGKVYFWPPGDTLDGHSVWAPSLYRLVHFQGNNDGSALIHDVVIQGLTLACTDRLSEDQWPDEWLKRNAEDPDAMLYMEGVSNCRVDGNTFMYSGSYCVALMNYAQGVTVVRNEMSYSGCGGVQLYGYGPGTLDVNHGNIVQRNYIHDTGFGGYLHSAAVTVYQSGDNDISLNWIVNVPYAGFMIAGAGWSEFGPGKTYGCFDAYGNYASIYNVRWNELPNGTNSTFSFYSFQPYLHDGGNHVRDNILTGYMQHMGDGGGLDSWYTALGNYWENNLLHRSSTYPGEIITMAIYMDAGVNGGTLTSNVCWHTGSGMMIDRSTYVPNVWDGNVLSATKPASYDTRLQQITAQAMGRGGWLNYPVASLPPFVGNPIPSDGQANVVTQPLLTWISAPADYPDDLYFGTNLQSVATATTNSPEYQGRLAVASFTPPTALTTNSTCYWRVDQVLAPTNIVAGSVWHFTIAPDTLRGGLATHYTFDARDTFAPITCDLAGPPYSDGTLSNSPVTVTGVVNQALNFDGASQYVQAPALGLYASTVTFTAWVKRNGSQSNGAVIVSCQSGLTPCGLSLGASNQLSYVWGGEAGLIHFDSGLVPPDGQWALAALVVDTNCAILSLGTTNGVLVSVTNQLPHVMQALDGPLGVAGDSSGGRYFYGAIDDVMVWSRALSGVELTTLFSVGLGGRSIEAPNAPGTFVWTGASDAWWNHPENWSANAVPSAADTVTFDQSASGNLATSLGYDDWVGGVVVSGGIGAMSVGGTNTLTVGGEGIVLSNTSASATFSAPMVLRAPQTWWIADNGTLNVSGGLQNRGWWLSLTNNHIMNLSGGVSGTGGLSVGGTGTVMLAGGTYTGDTIINNGKLSISNGTAFASPHVVINAGATLNFNTTGGGNSLAAVFMENGKNVAHTGAGVVTITGSGFTGFGGNVTALTFNLDSGAWFDVRGSDVQFGWVYGSFASNLSGLNVAAGAGFHNSQSAGFQFDALTGAGTVGNAYNGVVTLTVGVDNTLDSPAYGVSNHTANFSGTIKDHEIYDGATTANLNLIKTGAGTQILSGTNTYQGTTTVRGGALVVNGSLSGTNSVTVLSGATLGGRGIMNGSVVVQSGGTLAAAMGINEVGTLTITNTLALGSGSRTIMRLNPSAGTNDRIQGLGTLTYGGSLSVITLSGVLLDGQVYPLFSAAHYSGSYEGLSLPALTAGLAWDFSGLATNGTIAVKAYTGVNPPVDVPGNVHALQVGTSQVALNWSSVSNAISYVVSRDGIPLVVIVGTNWLDTGLSMGMTYGYTVAAVNPGGSSDTSPVVYVTMAPTLLWDANPAVGGVQDGSGVWGGPGNNWLYGSNNVAWLDTNVAAFGYDGATNYAVTITTDVCPAGIVFNATGGGVYTLAGGGGGINVSGETALMASNNAVISAVLKGAGAVIKAGPCVLSLSGTNVYTGGTVMSDGTLQIASTSALGSTNNTLTLNGGTLSLNRFDIAVGSLSGLGGTVTDSTNGTARTDTLTVNQTTNTLFGGLIKKGAINNIALVKTGPGSLALTGNNTYTGQTTVNAGTLNLAGGVSSLGNLNIKGTGAMLVTAGSTTFTIGTSFHLIGGTSGDNATVTMSGGTLTLAGSSSYVDIGSNGGTGLFTLNGGTYKDTTTYGTILAETGSTSCGTLNINGGTVVGNGGTTWGLRFGRGTGVLNLNSGGMLLEGMIGQEFAGQGTSTFNFNGGTLQAMATTVNFMSGLGTATISAAGANINDGGFAITITQALRGGGGLNKFGAGTLTLGGGDAYTGATVISNGTLVVSGSLSNTAVTVTSAGKLGGAGALGGAVTVSGTIAPGVGVGTLVTGAETWMGGGRYECEINSTNAAGCDRLNINGLLNVAATAGSPFTLRLVTLVSGTTPGPVAGFSKYASNSWTLATASGGVTNFDTSKVTIDTSAFTNDIGGGVFELAQAGTNLVLNYLAALMPPPAFTGIFNPGSGAVQLGGMGTAGQPYILVTTTNLVPADWQPVVTNIADTNGVFQFNHFMTNSPMRFYRIQGL